MKKGRSKGKGFRRKLTKLMQKKMVMVFVGIVLSGSASRMLPTSSLPIPKQDSRTLSVGSLYLSSCPERYGRKRVRLSG